MCLVTIVKQGVVMWQKNGEGLKYKGAYIEDQNGERIMVLTAIKSNGKVHTVTAESWQMLKKAGWMKCAKI